MHLPHSTASKLRNEGDLAHAVPPIYDSKLYEGEDSFLVAV